MATSVAKYGQGMVYGATIMEGTGRIGFGLAFARHANSISYAKTIKVSGQPVTYRYEETFSDFHVSILATYSHENASKTHVLLLALGPEVNFLTATKQYIVEGYSHSAQVPRLGLGVIARYERVIPAFGRTKAFLSVAGSWMEGAIETDEYAPPAESMGSAAVTAGLAFPF